MFYNLRNKLFVNLKHVVAVNKAKDDKHPYLYRL